MSERDEPEPAFLSYSSRNREIAERLEQDLRKRGIATWRDESYIQSGNDWEAKIREGIRQSFAFLYLASPDARASRVVRGELQVAKMYDKPIHLVWVEGEEWADAAPLEYIAGHYIDLREGQYEQRLQRLVAVLTHSPRPSTIGQQQEETSNMPLQSSKLYNSSSRQPRNPYKGLQAFTIEERDDFFGRRELIDEMIEEVKSILKIEQQSNHNQEPRFLTVVGPSGSGKSSVVMAGLLPRLQQGKDIPGSDSWIFLSPIRPGKEPLKALAQELLEQLPLGEHTEAQDDVPDDVLNNLWDDSTRGLHRYASELARQPGERIVLIVDQFEELFTETTDEAQRKQFVSLLTTAATERQNKTLIIVTLRADFSDSPMKSLDLHDIIEKHRIPTPPMTIENLQEVIECPARLPDVNVSFEENLVGDLLYEIRGHEENLPLLQFTLDKLFEERNQSTNQLTRQAYRAMGGVRGALSKHAQETYERLSLEEQRLARILFTRLINPGGLDQDATRRRVPRSEFVYSDATRQSQMQEVIDRFIAARLITTNEIETTNTATCAPEQLPIIEISHEALISAWSRLADWIKVARDDMFVRQMLNHDIDQWEEQNRPRNQLYSGYRLARIEALAQRMPLNTKEEAFLRACTKKLGRRRQAMNIGAMVLAFFLLIGGVAAGLAYAATRPTSTTVTTLQDSGPGSLSQIIQSAAPGSRITFDPSLQGTIYLNNKDLDIDKDLTISGLANQQITISNHNSKNGYKVHIHANTTVTFANLRFSNSTVQQSSFIDNEGDLTLNNCMVDHNTSYYNGGGIINYGGSLTLNNSAVENNISYGNGGGIFAWQGTTLKLINSKVYTNKASSNGGGIYAVGAGLTLSNSRVTDNKTVSSNMASNGGGISILNGMLQLDSDTTISGNETSGYGGGVALLGSNSFISKAVISNNSAGQKGGGLAVEENFKNKAHSLAAVSNVEITNAPQGSYWIGDNNAPTSPDILGKLPDSLTSQSMIINDDTSEINGSPAPLRPPEKELQYLGTVNLDNYCHALFPDQTSLRSVPDTTSENMSCELLSGKQIGQHINTQQACQRQYKQSDVIDRLADYYDPSSWQCYAHEKKLGGITNYLAGFCQFKDYEDSNNNGNAYEWDCLDKNHDLVPLSMADACQWYYQRSDAVDRLVNFNDPNGWECWASE